jgi:ribosomal protein S18 acetylase RimI-like enzyme
MVSKYMFVCRESSRVNIGPLLSLKRINSKIRKELQTTKLTRLRLLQKKNAAVIGGGIGGLLAVNNFMGKSVHVPDIPEAKNRITVDYSESLLRRKDIGFVAISDDSQFAPAGGVMATVDAQLRNSPDSPAGNRQVANLPSHMHVKNMLVHNSKRRLGVGRSLVEAVEAYARDKTDAKALTLEVEKGNHAAVNLYKKFGFVEQENPSKLSVFLFMVKDL